MNNRLHVNHEGLDMASTSLLSDAGQLQAVLSQLEADIKSKVSANWGGEAQTSFAAAKAKWDAGMDDLRLLLNQIGTTVGHANTEYRASDMRGANRFGH